MLRTQCDFAPNAPVLPYHDETGVTVGQCPHCKKPLTSDAFNVGGQLIPYNAPMLEHEAVNVSEGVPLTIPELSTKFSQDDPTTYVEERNRDAATKARKGWFQKLADRLFDF